MYATIVGPMIEKSLPIQLLQSSLLGVVEGEPVKCSSCI